MPVNDPFPLNIVSKIDSWEKLQQFQHTDPSLYYNAEEFNSIVTGLTWVYENMGQGGSSATVPIYFKSVVIDYTSDDLPTVKVAESINALDNYALESGAVYYFITYRVVLTNGNVGFPGPGGFYTVVVDHYALTKKIVPVGGVLSVGNDGTFLNPWDIQFLFSVDQRSLQSLEVDLGDIGSDEINDRVNITGPYSAPNGAIVIFIATQNAELRSWLYTGSAEEIGAGSDPTQLSDYRLFAQEDAGSVYQQTLPQRIFADAVTIELNNHEGRGYFLSSPSALLVHYLSNEIFLGKALIKINAVTQPTFTRMAVVVSGLFEVGLEYTIRSIGTTDFTLLGADQNTVGLSFLATSQGTGTGEASVNSLLIGGDKFETSSEMYVLVSNYGIRNEHRFISYSSLVDRDNIFTKFVQALGYKTAANDPDRLLASDGSLVDIATLGTGYVFPQGIALGSETDPLEVGQVVAFESPNFDVTSDWFSANVLSAPTGSEAIFDVKLEGVSVFSTLITIDADQTNSETATIPAVIGTALIPANSKITIEVVSVGSAAPGYAAKMWWYPKKTANIFPLLIAVGDEDTGILVGDIITFALPNYATTLLSVSGNLKGAPTGSGLVVDVKEASVTVLGDKITIDATQTNSVNAATQPTIVTSALPANGTLEIVVDAVGSGDAGNGLKVYIQLQKA